MSGNYSEGQSVVTEVEFRNTSDVLFDPTTVVLTYRNPNGNTGVATATKISTGIYQATISANIVGIWRWRWTGTTGTSTLVDEGSFCVVDSLVLA